MDGDVRVDVMPDHVRCLAPPRCYRALAKAAKEDDNEYVRAAASKLLAKLQPYLMQQLIDAGEVDAVVAKLEDSETFVRIAAVQTLGQLQRHGTEWTW